MRPLDPLRSIKTKLGVIIVAATVLGVGTSAAGTFLGLPKPFGAVLGISIALTLVQVLARGMTSPLREMAAASKAMASGDYSRRVRATANDEVGQLAHAFNMMAEDLAETDRVRRDLVANVSHELRTPISGLQAALENIVDGVSPADSEVLRTMLLQTERLGRLVAELLDLSRLESGVVQLQPVATPVGPLVDECVDEVRLTHPIDVRVDVDPVDATVYVDAGRFRQVVINLLMNAARVTPQGGLVRVRVDQTREDLRLVVEDDGPGIPLVDRRRVFERFYRADAARSTDGGSGLGLAIVKWIVDLHGGSIVVDDNRPTGCRMIVVLPKGDP